MNGKTDTNPHRKWAALGVFLALAFAVSFTGSYVTLPKIPGWYAGLVKPSFSPPSWVFGPVWTFLYIVMSVAAWRVWLSPSGKARIYALRWYFVQLALNAIWPQVFFGLERPGFALAVIVALLVAIVVTVLRFRPIDRMAAWLLAPYLAWVSFATVLNGAFAALN